MNMRKQKKFHFIYKTTNLLSGKYYIGLHSTDNLNDGYLGSGTYLRRSLNKYGKENHSLEILEFCNSREELKSREEEIVNLNEIAKKECMNMRVGGIGGFISEEHRKKFIKSSIKGAKTTNKKRWIDNREYNIHQMSERVKKLWQENKLPIRYGEDNSFYGKSHTEETKRKIGEINSKKQKGKNNSQYGTCWITNDVENKKIKKGDKIPVGFYLGRKLKDVELKETSKEDR